MLDKVKRELWSLLLGTIGLVLGVGILWHVVQTSVTYVAFFVLLKDVIVSIFFLSLAFVSFNNFWHLLRSRQSDNKTATHTR